MQGQAIEYIFLILIILGLVMLSERLRIAYPIVLVLGGLALSLMPWFSGITIDPELVFFIFLPPLLYEAAWQVSWKEFWRFRRVIMSFAFPIVILTAGVVAFVAPMVVPGFTLALGFLLGGIVSPPDAVSASAVMRRVKVPRTMLRIIEGESLMNDAASLIVFRFALAAIATGQFHWQEAAWSFVLVIVMGTLIGLGLGLLFYAIHRYLPTTPSVDIVLTFVTPYCMYYAAEHFHFSGVLAVVSGGLFLSTKRQQMLSYQSRIQAVNVWNSLVFVLNGLVFLLIGLQLPHVVSQLDGNVPQAIGYGLAISGLLIVTRLLCAYGAVVWTMVAARFITVADSRPGWRGPTILGWAGMRGVVSLAAALSIPVLLPGGEAFPHRAMILFITFIVILVTLVFQGLTLPWLIRLVNPEDRSTIPLPKQDLLIQKKMALYSLKHLEEKHGSGNLDNQYLSNLQARFQLDRAFYDHELLQDGTNDDDRDTYLDFYLNVLEQQRHLLDAMNHKAEFDEDLIRKYLTLVDMEEYKVREKMRQEV